MFLLSLLLSLLIAPLGALTVPTNPSIIQLPSGNATTTNLQDFPAWPALPWVYHQPNSQFDINFLGYSRKASNALTRQIYENLDVIIYGVLHSEDNEFSVERWQVEWGIVRVTVDFLKPGVRTTTLALALQQLRDLLGDKYGPREIAMAALRWMGSEDFFALMKVDFLRVL